MPRIIKKTDIIITNITEDINDSITNPKEDSKQEVNLLIEETKKQARKEIEEELNLKKEKCLQEIEELKKKAYSEALEQGTQEGLHKGFLEGKEQGITEGYQEGKQQGEHEAYTKVKEETKSLFQELTNMIELIEDNKQSILHNYEEGITELSLTIAEKILKHKLDTDKEIVTAIVADVTNEYKNLEWIKVNLPVVDKETEIAIDTELAKILKNVSKDVRIIYKEELSEGSCIVETPDSIVDASIDVQLETLKDDLLTTTEK